jgi:prevent-host-death family protein
MKVIMVTITLIMKEARMPKTTTINVADNVADAKRQFADLLGRVAYGGETITITRRGKPMARLVPVDADTAAPHIADARGWLEDGDPFFTTIDTIVADRETHHPRALRPADH